MDLESFRKRFPLEDGEKVVGVVFWPPSAYLWALEARW